MIARALVALSSGSGLQKGRTCNENMSERVRCTSLAQGAISILASSLWRGKVFNDVFLGLIQILRKRFTEISFVAIAWTFAFMGVGE